MNNLTWKVMMLSEVVRFNQFGDAGGNIWNLPLVFVSVNWRLSLKTTLRPYVLDTWERVWSVSRKLHIQNILTFTTTQWSKACSPHTVLNNLASRVLSGSVESYSKKKWQWGHKREMEIQWIKQKNSAKIHKSRYVTAILNIHMLLSLDKCAVYKSLCIWNRWNEM